jgi:hypothetical protein
MSLLTRACGIDGDAGRRLRVDERVSISAGLNQCSTVGARGAAVEPLVRLRIEISCCCCRENTVTSSSQKIDRRCDDATSRAMIPKLQSGAVSSIKNGFRVERECELTNSGH